MEEKKVGVWKQNDEGYWYTPRTSENQRLFDELMKRKPYKGDSWKTNIVFTNEEMEFLGAYNLDKFADKFPNEAYWYMEVLD